MEATNSPGVKKPSTLDEIISSHAKLYDRLDALKITLTILIDSLYPHPSQNGKESGSPKNPRPTAKIHLLQWVTTEEVLLADELCGIVNDLRILL